MRSLNIKDLKIKSNKLVSIYYYGRNRKIYGVISEEIHEFDEKKCLEMFPYVSTAIELILNDFL